MFFIPINYTAVIRNATDLTCLILVFILNTYFSYFPDNYNANVTKF